MSTKNDCSLKDTKLLRELIPENPELPLIIFCGEDSCSGECVYQQADASRGEAKISSYMEILGSLKKITERNYMTI